MKIKSPQYLNVLDHDTYQKERKHGVFTSKNIIQDEMIVYHGTTLSISEPKIVRSEIGRDFGFAFCTEKSLHSLEFIESYQVEKGE